MSKNQNTSAKWDFFYMFSQLRNRLPQTSMHPKPAMRKWDQNKMITKVGPVYISHLAATKDILAKMSIIWWYSGCLMVFLNIQDHSGELWPQIPGPCRERQGPGPGFFRIFWSQGICLNWCLGIPETNTWITENAPVFFSPILGCVLTLDKHSYIGWRSSHPGITWAMEKNLVG